jgi:hypothetical protein
MSYRKHAHMRVSIDGGTVSTLHSKQHILARRDAHHHSLLRPASFNRHMQLLGPNVSQLFDCNISRVNEDSKTYLSHVHAKATYMVCFHPHWDTKICSDTRGAFPELCIGRRRHHRTYDVIAKPQTQGSSWQDYKDTRRVVQPLTCSRTADDLGMLKDR